MPITKTPLLIATVLSVTAPLLLSGAPVTAQTTSSASQSASASPQASPDCQHRARPMKHGRKQAMERGQRHEQRAKAIETSMDANKDGIITRAEFRAVRPDRFDLIDANKDGKLTQDEITAFRNARTAQRDTAKN